jgi:large subunit ribosomal protein L30
MYAVIRLRGKINVSPNVNKTFELLNLNSINNMSVWAETKQALKMIKSVENYATFGIINEETLKELIEKKGRTKEGKIDTEKVLKGLKEGKTIKEMNLINCFKMNPPLKGHERKGIKKPYSLGGALGNRKEKINELIKKMM